MHERHKFYDTFEAPGLLGNLCVAICLEMQCLKHFEATFYPYARRETSEPGSTGKLRRAFLTNCRARKRTESIQIDIWASVCPLGVPLDSSITKMVSLVPQMEPQGLQKGPAAGGEALEYISFRAQLRNF